MKPCSSCGLRATAWRNGGRVCSVCVRLTAYVLGCAREEWRRIEDAE